MPVSGVVRSRWVGLSPNHHASGGTYGDVISLIFLPVPVVEGMNAGWRRWWSHQNYRPEPKPSVRISGLVVDGVVPAGTKPAEVEDRVQGSDLLERSECYHHACIPPQMVASNTPTASLARATLIEVMAEAMELQVEVEDESIWRPPLPWSITQVGPTPTSCSGGTGTVVLEPKERLRSFVPRSISWCSLRQSDH